MEGGATMISAVTSGVTALSSSIVTTITAIVGSPECLALIGLGVGFAIVRFGIRVLPMMKR